MRHRALVLALAVALTIVLDTLQGPQSVVNTLIASFKGERPERPPDIPFVASPHAVVDQLLRLARVTPNDVVYDLGSGDGRIVIAAARTYQARAVGIELDPKMIRLATRNAERAGVARQVAFREEDLFQADISDATVVVLFLDPSMNQKLRPKLEAELRPGARIVSHAFGMSEWTPEKTIMVARRPLFLWQIREKR
jgi:SAM-dependent methyltransferase